MRAAAAQAQRGVLFDFECFADRNLPMSTGDSRRMQSGKCKDLTFEECLAQHPRHMQSEVIGTGTSLAPFGPGVETR